MVKTIPFISEKVWGYEKWIVSVHEAGQSLIEESQEKLSTLLTKDFPILIKIIQANDTLSVQVHPDDCYAKEKENSLGKNECWYILDAKPNATLVCGLKEQYTREELQNAIKNNSLEEYLNYIPVKKGDFVFIPAGTVHAIQGGLRILEVQQSSDVTYRMYDWGRPREMHIEKSLDVIKPINPTLESPFSKNFTCQYFSLSEISVQEEKKKLLFESAKNNFVTLFITSGEGTLYSQSENKSISVKKEDTIIVKSSEIIFAENHSSAPLSIMIID